MNETMFPENSFKSRTSLIAHWRPEAWQEEQAAFLSRLPFTSQGEDQWAWPLKRD